MIYAQYRSQPSFVVRARKRRVVVAAPARAIDRSRHTARERNARRVSLARGEPRREFRARTTRSIDRARARGLIPARTPMFARTLNTVTLASAPARATKRCAKRATVVVRAEGETEAEAAPAPVKVR